MPSFPKVVPPAHKHSASGSLTGYASPPHRPTVCTSRRRHLASLALPCCKRNAAIATANPEPISRTVVPLCGPGWLHPSGQRLSSVLTPPMAELRPVALEAHGDARTDGWLWLSNKDDPEVIALHDAKTPGRSQPWPTPRRFRQPSPRSWWPGLKRPTSQFPSNRVSGSTAAGPGKGRTTASTAADLSMDHKLADR